MHADLITDETHRNGLTARLAGTEGWFHEDEAAALFDAVVTRRGPLRVVEIGSWKGRSTVALATALDMVEGGGRVVAIDPHTGSREHREMWGRVDTFIEFMTNLERAGVSTLVEPVRRSSHEARADFVGLVDVLFVDGSHEYADVLQDLDDWLPLLADGALLVLNDTSWPGVHDAVRARLLGRRSCWRRLRLVRSTLFLERDPEAAWTRRDDAGLLLVRAALAGRRQAGRVVGKLPPGAKRVGNKVTGALTRLA